MHRLPTHQPSKKFSQHREDTMINRIHYWKRVKHMMEMHDIKEKSIHFRKKLLDDRARTNYQNEYDQIRGALAHTVIPAHTKATIERRQAELVKLGAKIA